MDSCNCSECHVNSHQHPQPNMSTLQVMSNHIIEESLMKGIPKFAGVAHTFWPWAGKIENYIGSLNPAMKPLKILQLLESYSTGEPQTMISHMMAATGNVTMNDVECVWRRLVERSASPQKIARELTAMITNFKLIEEEEAGMLLSKLHDISKIIDFNIPRCPDLIDMNFAKGIQPIRNKLPVPVQI